MEKVTASTKIKSTSGSSSSLLDWITKYDSLVIFGGVGFVILITIILNGMFQAGDPYRSNVLYNAFGALMMAAGFIYLIFSFMGQQIIIYGKPIDIGMIVYICIILFVMFVLGN